METWVALLRGINVGGHRKLPMQRLVEILEGLGYSAVRTYIQSGNAVFRASRPKGPDIAEAIDNTMGFRPEVLLISYRRFEEAVRANPFPDAVDDPKSLHLFFLAGEASSNAEERLADVASDREEFVLAPGVLYLHALDYLTGSRIGERAERLLGTPTTARNWNSASRILALAEGVDSGGDDA